MPAIKRLRAPFIVMFGVIMATVAFALPASAAPYTTQPTTSVSSQTPAAGSNLTFCGADFLPGETVTIVLNKGRGPNATSFPSVVANTSGAFCTTIVLGASLNGTQTLTATGATSRRTSTTTIRVVKAGKSGVAAQADATANAGLAFTGTNAIGTAALGGLLLIGGAAMVLTARRRKVNA